MLDPQLTAFNSKTGKWEKVKMSHPVNDEITEELAQGLAEIVGAYHHLRQYILADRERLEFLDRNDIQFLNRISQAIKEYNPYGTKRNQEDEDNSVEVHTSGPQDEQRRQDIQPDIQA